MFPSCNTRKTTTGATTTCGTPRDVSQAEHGASLTRTRTGEAGMLFQHQPVDVCRLVKLGSTKEKQELEDWGFCSRKDGGTGKMTPDYSEGTACRVSGGYRYTMCSRIGARWSGSSGGSEIKSFTPVMHGSRAVHYVDQCNYNEWKEVMLASGNHNVSFVLDYVEKPQHQEAAQRKRRHAGCWRHLGLCFGQPLISPKLHPF